MRTHSLASPVDGTPSEIWVVLVDIAAYGAWNTTIPSATGSVAVGATLDLRLRRPGGGLRPFRPTLRRMVFERELELAAAVGHRALIEMVHTFTIEPVSAASCLLRQHWTARGVLMPLLWPLLRRDMDSFAAMGRDLAVRVETLRRGGCGAAK